MMNEDSTRTFRKLKRKSQSKKKSYQIWKALSKKKALEVSTQWTKTKHAKISSIKCMKIKQFVHCIKWSGFILWRFICMPSHTSRQVAGTGLLALYEDVDPKERLRRRLQLGHATSCSACTTMQLATTKPDACSMHAQWFWIRRNVNQFFNSIWWISEYINDALSLVNVATTCRRSVQRLRQRCFHSFWRCDWPKILTKIHHITRHEVNCVLCMVYLNLYDAICISRQVNITFYEFQGLRYPLRHL